MVYTRQLNFIGIFIILGPIILFTPQISVYADQPDNNDTDIFDMSLEELLDVEVVTTSRQSQKIGQTTSAISIITQDDIHYGGLSSFGEILQFSPGIDMYRFNRYEGFVGIRGLHDRFSDRMQTLINGRLADNVLFGGPLLYTFPVNIEDVKRIEIVRGPGGAAWGANALNGVINIITKKPEDMLGTFISTKITEYGDTYTHLRYADKEANWQWRISGSYQDIIDSDKALDGGAAYESIDPSLNGLIGISGYTARDFARISNFDSEFIYDAQNDTEISMGAAYSSGVFGDFEFGGFFPRENSRFERFRPFIKVNRVYDNSDSASLEWSSDYTMGNYKSIAIAKLFDNSITGQYNFAPSDSHERSIGANLRWTHINMDYDYDQQAIFLKEPFDEYWTGLFAVDKWQATDRVTIEAQVRGDWYSEIDNPDWSSRLTSLYVHNEEKDSVFRFSLAKAYRSPMVGLREPSMSTIPVGGGFYLLNTSPPDDLKNEQVFSVETGYSTMLKPGITFRADSYYQRYEDLIGYNDKQVIGGLVYSTADNYEGANAWGSEIELSYQNKKGKLSVWYAYNDFQEDKSHQDIRAMLPAKHKTGLTGRIFLPDGLTFNCNYKFSNTTPDDPSLSSDIGSYHRLDLTISRKFASQRGEFMFGVTDLLNKATEPHPGIGSLTAHEVPGQTFFARMQIRF